MVVFEYAITFIIIINHTNNQYMTMRIHIQRLLVIILSIVLCFTDVSAKKKPNRHDLKREHAAADYDFPQASPLPKKSRPDGHPHAKESIKIVGASNWTNGTHGFDISHYQGRIDWATFSKDPNCSFVYCKATEGENFVDNTYKYNISEARRHRVKVGSYHFFRPGVSAERQMENIRRNVDPRQQDLLFMLDVEVLKGASLSVFYERLDQLLDLLTKEYGKRPIIYTGKNLYNKYFHGHSRYRAYKFWIANYTSIEPTLNGNDDYVIWQYSGYGRAQGVRGDIDCNKLHGRHTLRELAF